MDDGLIKASDLAGLSKAAEKIVDAVRDGVGGVFLPWQIKRVADAEAKAKIIHAEADTQILDIQQRAQIRREAAEIRKQENLESIVSKSLAIEQDSVSEDTVHQDWLEAFFSTASESSDDKMQELWARLLSGEVSHPGTYSRRTIESVKLLSADDARYFTSVCQLGLSLSGHPMIVIPDHTSEHVTSRGVNFSVLQHLESVGLILFESLAGLEQRFNLQGHKRIVFRSVGGAMTLEPKVQPDTGEIVLPIGKVRLTTVGTELSRLVDFEIDLDYVQYLLNFYSKSGFIATFSLPDGSSLVGS